MEKALPSRRKAKRALLAQPPPVPKMVSHFRHFPNGNATRLCPLGERFSVGTERSSDVLFKGIA
jgi:hypothetical protein